MVAFNKISLEIKKRISISLDAREERRYDKFKRHHKHRRDTK